MEQSLEILKLVGLDNVKYELAKNLPHGYQKMLGVARALAVKPKLLLLSAKNTTVHYGKSLALDKVSLEMDEGSVVTIIGANGAGKRAYLGG